jgi:tRNA(fMet)-specific endonuclease VapC
MCHDLRARHRLVVPWQHGHPALSARVAEHSPADLAIAVITVQEQIDGWHSQLSRAKRRARLAQVYDRLAECVRFLARLQILSFTEPAISRYEHIRSLKLNIGKMDLRIAAIVLENGATLVTRNRRDFQKIPGLLIEDWST